MLSLDSQFDVYKPFNAAKQQLTRFRNDGNFVDQPDSVWLNLPDEIQLLIFAHYTLDSFGIVRGLCKRFNQLADRRAEKIAFENTLARFDGEKRKLMLDWWYNVLKLRAYSFNDPTFIIEYLNFKVDLSSVVDFCMIENISNIYLSFKLVQTQAIRKPRQELASMIQFDADEILTYFIEMFEDEFKEDKWSLMTNAKFHSFAWCLLVAFESYFTQEYARDRFLKMRLRPVFMNFMSKYSPVVLRLLMNSDILQGSKKFPLLPALPYKVLRGLLEQNDYQFDLTSTMPIGKNIPGDPTFFCLPPLELACFTCSQPMFNELAKHTPIIPSAGYFPALTLSTNNAEDKRYFYDELLAKQIDINGKLSPVLKSNKYSWIETVLGLACFDYRTKDEVVLTEWLLIHGAKFSENELKAIRSATKLQESVDHVLKVIQSNEKYNPFKSCIEWNPKPSENFTLLNVVSSLRFEANEHFAFRYGKTLYHGKWQRGRKTNHIVCSASAELTDIVLRGSYDNVEPQWVVSTQIWEFFAYQTVAGKLLLLKEDAELLHPSMELITNAWLPAK